jgi:hypothetical protein
VRLETTFWNWTFRFQIINIDKKVAPLLLNFISAQYKEPFWFFRTSSWVSWHITLKCRVIGALYIRRFCKNLFIVASQTARRSLKPSLWTERQYKDGQLIFQKTLKLNFLKYSPNVFTIHWLLSQRTSPQMRKCVYVTVKVCNSVISYST